MNTAGSHLHEGLRQIKFIETESRRVVAEGWGRGEGSECLVGTDFQCGKMKMTELWRWLG